MASTGNVFQRTHEGMNPWRWWWRVVLGVLAFTTTCFVLLGVQPLGQSSKNRDSFHGQSLDVQGSRQRPEWKPISGNLTILLWTSFYDDWNYMPESHSGCPVHCDVTSDRNQIRNSHAIVFHCRDLDMVDLPKLRWPFQHWVFYCLESPEYSYFVGFHHMSNMFNLTMTYRLDSDVVIPYGFLHKTVPGSFPEIKDKDIQLSNLSSKKNIFWLVSHCKTASQREDYVEELSKWTKVDIFGSCGQKTCKRDQSNSCFQELSNQYKFVLAFENSLCKDYATEKFFKALRYNVVPVVYGGANYAKIAPPNSYIDALSFKTARHLAEHLELVGNNRTLYNSYLSWKKQMEVRLLSDQTRCRLCQRLHSQANLGFSYDNMYNWWVDKGPCFKWHPS